jgi:hypothetical protein
VGGIDIVVRFFFAFWVLALLVGVFAFALASALCLRASCVAVRWLWPVRWHPRFAFVLQALPLCGAAPTFLCRRKEK